MPIIRGKVLLLALVMDDCRKSLSKQCRVFHRASAEGSRAVDLPCFAYTNRLE